MKVFKFTSEEYYWAVSGETKEQAKNYLFEVVGEMTIDKVEEIPENEWDEKIISVWEDNDFETEPFKVSIREEMFSSEPQIIYSNDLNF